jgi:hypothetical protein
MLQTPILRWANCNSMIITHDGRAARHTKFYDGTSNVHGKNILQFSDGPHVPAVFLSNTNILRVFFIIIIILKEKSHHNLTLHLSSLCPSILFFIENEVMPYILRIGQEVQSANL